MIKLNEAQQKILSLVMSVFFLGAMMLLSREAADYAKEVSGSRVVVGRDSPCVVLDPGHGGFDPGKIGINGALEKDVNLQIALLVKQYLEENDIRVVLTREEDAGLYDADASNKKVQDMKRRIELIDETAPDITVSIHQNSYPEEYVNGAQVFYYNGSKEGQQLAALVQEQLVEKVAPENKRQIKPNDSYYMLKKTGVPIVIVECGFLSNSAEAEKLCSPQYQERVAWAIHMGILQYLEQAE
ncbi:MAG: N-acetylmuramoyl-L-alanine amidase [Roseburia sp.]|nr:N-acetylmuramoyl-L-alanine amidase [Roseburia sp.]